MFTHKAGRRVVRGALAAGRLWTGGLDDSSIYVFDVYSNPAKPMGEAPQ